MRYSEPARTTLGRIRIRWIRVAGLLGVIAAITAALGNQVLASSSWMAPSAIEGLRSEHRGTPGEADGQPMPPVSGGTASLANRATMLDTNLGLGEADGAVPDGTSVFDDEIPGVAKLDPALLGALREAATEAAGDGIEFLVDSGWRSRRYQGQLLREAILKYGSEAEATRWVATPGTSAHVKGDAVDIGPSAAAAWLSQHGAAYGLCRIVGNEPWHFELRP